MSKAKQEQRLWVRVSGWQRHREVILRENSVEMMIALINCSHCATCSRRIETVNAVLEGKESQWRREGGGYHVVLPYPADMARDEQSVAVFLRETLQLPLSLAM